MLGRTAGGERSAITSSMLQYYPDEILTGSYCHTVYPIGHQARRATGQSANEYYRAGLTIFNENIKPLVQDHQKMSLTWAKSLRYALIYTVDISKLQCQS